MDRSLLLAFLLFAHGLFGQAPLTIQASAKKARTVVGEGILISLRLSLSSNLDMETVELNRDRTTVRITRQDPPGETRVLSGKDYISLHHVEPLGQVGRSFHGKAGASWTSELNLFSYTYPLAAGKYHIDVSYRYGNDSSSMVRANDVPVEVAPATLRNAQFRWFGGSAAREELGTLWSAEDAGSTHWFYQVSEASDPAVVRSAIELTEPIPNTAAPRLAHLNDIADNHLLRFAVWLEERRLCWLKIADMGTIGRSSCEDVGLPSGTALRLADPPLQTRDDGLTAVVLGGDKLSLVHVNAKGQTEHRLIPLSAQTSVDPVVLWAEPETPPQGTVYGVSGGQIWKLDLASGRQANLSRGANDLTLVVDQWLGHGNVYSASRAGAGVEVRTISPAAAPPVVIPFPGTWKLAGATPLAAGRGLALTAATPEGWAVVTSHDRRTGTSAPPHVIASAKTLFLVRHDPQRGFSIIR